MNERLRKLRKALNMSQTAFGKFLYYQMYPSLFMI